MRTTTVEKLTRYYKEKLTLLKPNKNKGTTSKLLINNTTISYGSQHTNSLRHKKGSQSHKEDFVIALYRCCYEVLQFKRPTLLRPSLEILRIKRYWSTAKEGQAELIRTYGTACLRDEYSSYHEQEPLEETIKKATQRCFKRLLEKENLSLELNEPLSFTAADRTKYYSLMHQAVIKVLKKKIKPLPQSEKQSTLSL